MPSAPSKELVAIPNPHPGREYEVECVCPEFTCICPMTAQPDFATFTITYVPGPKILELKSLKLYLWSYRNEGAFHEGLNLAALWRLPVVYLCENNGYAELTPSQVHTAEGQMALAATGPLNTDDQNQLEFGAAKA